MNRPRHLGLQIKLTVALVLIVLLPLIASAVLIDQIGKVAANYGATESRERTAMIELGRWDQTLVATYDEFGRSPIENEDGGTHHGRPTPQGEIG